MGQSGRVVLRKNSTALNENTAEQKQAAEHACINSFLLLTGCGLMPSEVPAAWTSLLSVTVTWNCGLNDTLSPIVDFFFFLPWWFICNRKLEKPSVVGTLIVMNRPSWDFSQATQPKPCSRTPLIRFWIRIVFS